MKRRHITLQYLRRVTFRIDRHKQHLQAAGIRTQFLHDLCHLAQRCGTHVGAMGKSEKHRDHLALKIREGAGLAVVIGQAERLAE